MHSEFRYSASGLDNVIIRNMEVVVDDAGEEVYAIPNIVGLHKMIAYAIIRKKHGLTHAELRFLRTEMGLTQAQLAQIVKLDHQTIGRWERGETPIDQNAEFVVRMVAAEALEINPELSPREMAQRCVPSAVVDLIEIDGSDPQEYRLLNAA